MGVKNNELLPLYINTANLGWGVSDTNYLSISTIEALACGVPVILPNRQYIGMGKERFMTKVNKMTLPPQTGFLIDDDSKKVAGKLLELENNRKILMGMKRECQNFVKEYYGYDNAEKVYKRLYNC